jgi:hypothetical protein
LGRSQEAVEAWRAYARNEHVDHDEAVEAEALAQVLAPPDPAHTIDLVELTYAIDDPEGTLEKLQSDDRCESMDVDLSRLGGDGPPPKAVFQLLDRPMPEEVPEDLEIDQLPRLLCQVLLYGKETDRPARLAFPNYRGEGLEEVHKVLREVIGEALEEPLEEKILATAPLSITMTRFMGQLPASTSRRIRNRILRKVRRHILLERWPDAPHEALQGMTPREASQDDAMRLPLEATVLVMETTDSERESNQDYQQLREQLGLPEPAAPDVERAVRIPLLRLLRIDPEPLSDAEVKTLLMQGITKSSRMLTVRFGRELLKREATDMGFHRDELLALLSRQVQDEDEAIELIQTAQKLVVKRGESPAMYKIQELALRAARQEPAEFQALLADIQTHHLREPGISQVLVQQLTRLGLIRTDPRQAAPPAPPASAEAPLVVGATPTSAPEVAPTEPTETPSSGEGKSKLWLPGMD